MKANFGILPPLEQGGKKLGKRERGQAYASRALEDLDSYLSAQGQVQ
jgi:folate-dependent tRNA-U54 methylase TrmFO/GidA